MAKDPVCGMELEENQVKNQLYYDEKIYYFCSPRCRAFFENDPAKYLNVFEEYFNKKRKVAIVGSGQVGSRNVHAYIIGEHGDSEVPVWSQVNIAGVTFREYCTACRKNCLAEEREAIFGQVKNFMILH